VTSDLPAPPEPQAEPECRAGPQRQRLAESGRGRGRAGPRGPGAACPRSSWPRCFTRLQRQNNTGPARPHIFPAFRVTRVSGVPYARPSSPALGPEPGPGCRRAQSAGPLQPTGVLEPAFALRVGRAGAGAAQAQGRLRVPHGRPAPTQPAADGAARCVKACHGLDETKGRSAGRLSHHNMVYVSAGVEPGLVCHVRICGVKPDV
jgi:hypothetical protein